MRCIETIAEELPGTGLKPPLLSRRLCPGCNSPNLRALVLFDHISKGKVVMDGLYHGGGALWKGMERERWSKPKGEREGK